MVLSSASSLVKQIQRLGENRAGWFQVGAAVHVSPRRSTAAARLERGSGVQDKRDSWSGWEQVLEQGWGGERRPSLRILILWFL